MKEVYIKFQPFVQSQTLNIFQNCKTIGQETVKTKKLVEYLLSIKPDKIVFVGGKFLASRYANELKDLTKFEKKPIEIIVQ